MKVINAPAPNITGNIENAAKKEVKKDSFSGEFEKASSEHRKQNLLEITKEIFSQGELVAERCDIKELEKYKKMISSFFNELMEDSYQLSDNNGIFSKRKMYQNVKKINTDIEKIASELLRAQQSPIEILACVEDIRGLILDIFL